MAVFQNTGVEITVYIRMELLRMGLKLSELSSGRWQALDSPLRSGVSARFDFS